MKYTDLVCEGCGIPFTDEDDVVVCPVCGTPQHRACWQKNNCCVNNEKHSDDFAWEMPEWKKKENTPAPVKKPRPQTRNDEIAERIKFKNDEGAVACPKCGQLNYGKDAFCIKCHSPLNEEVERMVEEPIPELIADGVDEEIVQDIRMERNRDFFNQYGGISPTEEIDGIPVGELSAYIGGAHPGRMIRRFMMMDRGGRKFSINPPVILLRPVWYLYRGLTKWAMIMLAVIFALNLVANLWTLDMDVYRNYYGVMFDYLEDLTQRAAEGEGVVAFSMDDFNSYVEKNAPDLTLSSKMSGVDYAVVYACQFGMMAVEIAAILFADNLYRRKIKKDILEIRARNNNMEDYMADLRKSGGGRPGMAVVGVILTLAVYYLPAFIISFVALMQVFASR